MSRIAHNGPQVAEGGYTQTLKRSTDMAKKSVTSKRAKTGRLQQPAVPRRSIVLSESRIQKLYDDVHEAGMKVRIAARQKGVPGGLIDDLLFEMQRACCDAALASVRERI